MANRNTNTKPEGGIKPEPTVNTGGDIKLTPPLNPGDVVKVDKVVKDKEATPETVTMTKEQYEKMMKTMSDFATKLDAVADKNRLEQFKERNKDNSILPTAGISKVDGKYVIGWKLVSNEAEFRDGKYKELQIVELMYQDGTKQKMDLLDFYRNKVKVSCEITSKSDVDGEKEYTLRTPEGEELSLSIKFLN
jgi:hypothetical protein